MQPDVADAIRRIDVYGYADIRGGERRGYNRAERVASGSLHSPFRNRSARIHFDDLRGYGRRGDHSNPGDLDGFLLLGEGDIRDHCQSPARGTEQRNCQPQLDH